MAKRPLGNQNHTCENHAGEYTHGGDRSKAAARFSVPEDQLIDFSSNINPLGLHPGIKSIIENNIHKIMFYPDPDCIELRQKLSAFYHIPQQYILAGNGSAELIDLLVRTLAPSHALIPEPNFSEYAHSLNLTGTKIYRSIGSPKNGFKIQVEILVDNINNHLPTGGIVFISNPNNPSGYIYTKKELETILDVCEQKKCVLVVDEAFIQFTEGAEKNSMVNHVQDSENLAVLQAFTKIFAVPGIRLGMIMANPQLINRMRERQVRWSVNSLAQEIGTALVDEKDFLKDTVVYTHIQRQKMVNALSAIPDLEFFESHANYILCRIVFDVPVEHLEQYLGKQGFLIRNCSNYHGLDHRYFRIAVREEKENQRLLELIQLFFAQAKLEN